MFIAYTGAAARPIGPPTAPIAIPRGRQATREADTPDCVSPSSSNATPAQSPPQSYALRSPRLTMSPDRAAQAVNAQSFLLDALFS